MKCYTGDYGRVGLCHAWLGIVIHGPGDSTVSTLDRRSVFLGRFASKHWDPGAAENSKVTRFGAHFGSGAVLNGDPGSIGGLVISSELIKVARCCVCLSIANFLELPKVCVMQQKCGGYYDRMLVCSMMVGVQLQSLDLVHFLLFVLDQEMKQSELGKQNAYNVGDDIDGRDPDVSHLHDVQWYFSVATLILLQVLRSSKGGVQVLNGISDTAWLYDSEVGLDHCISIMSAAVMGVQQFPGPMNITASIYSHQVMVNGALFVRQFQLSNAPWEFQGLAKQTCVTLSQAPCSTSGHVQISVIPFAITNRIDSVNFVFIDNPPAVDIQGKYSVMQWVLVFTLLCDFQEATGHCCAVLSEIDLQGDHNMNISQSMNAS
jgi:hypothetical protein